MSSGEVARVIILRGVHEHFQKSMCDAISSDRFLWGLKDDKEIAVLNSCRDCLIILYVTKTFSLRRGARKKKTSSEGFALIARFIEEVPLPEGKSPEPYWPREFEDNFRYGYRFWLQPLYVSKCFLEKCEVGVVYGKECFVPKESAVKSIGEACNISTNDVEKTIDQKANIYIIEGCVAEALVKALRLSDVLVEFKPQQKQVVQSPVGVVESKATTAISDPILGKLSNASLDIVVSVAVLFAGKGILLVGPPGSGKTSFLTDLLKRLGIDFALETGNPEWTPFDTIGGFTVGGEGYVKGFVTIAVERCRESLARDGKPYWLIVDEINRANVDLAFGKLFTLLDPVYRTREKLRLVSVEGSKTQAPEYVVPLSFRVLATMNSFDRAILHKLGYALMRRFAVVRHEDLKRLRAVNNVYIDVDVSVYSRLDRDECLAELGIDVERVLSELLLKSNEISNDYLVVSPQLHSILNEKRFEALIINGVRLDKVLSCLATEMNRELVKYADCEVCPVQITPGVVADALKYIAVLNTLLDVLGLGDIDAGKRVALALDTATLFYLLPQIDVLADYARLESLGGRRSQLQAILNSVSEMLGGYSLVLSKEAVTKISRGYHIA